ncbi:SNF2 family N-terminal domain-containing protein [Apiospora arundinis]|uniref:SNF2 family N-terminal domain-containing protein n=1 Tax=Apiospora arundinis TaxID=335852 RepID=A0ABR2J7C7_9PEZI
MGRMSGLAGSSSPCLPGTPSIGAQAKGKMNKQYDIDDDDIDELAENIPCSSPYFTQPTQIVNRANAATGTQPTQIVERKPTLHKSSPAPLSPGTVVEVPASSPFQSVRPTVKASAFRASPPVMAVKPAVKPAVKLGVKPASKTDGRIGSLMAPAGTAFRSPNFMPRRTIPAVTQKQRPSDLSDDDLSNDFYKGLDSSEDDKPMRGNIQPVLGVARSGRNTPVDKRKILEEDIKPNDITDLRLRYLTKETHKVIVATKPNITWRACKNAVVRNSLSAEAAINDLLGRPKQSSSSTIGRPAAAAAVKGKALKQSKLFQSKITTNSRPRSLSPSSSSASESSASETEAEPEQKTAAPRRRLIQGRRNKPTSPPAPAVFSLPPSRSSPISTPSSSSSQQKMTVAAVKSMGPLGHQSTQQSPESAPKKRGRLVRGSRRQSPITLADSESDDDLPSLQTLASRKRKADDKSAPEVIDLTDSEPEAAAADTDSAANDSPPPSPTKGLTEVSKVIQYFNECSAEELARISGMKVSDTKLVVAARPFSSLREVEQVSRKEKASSRKSSRIQIGAAIVEKLVVWFRAFKAASDVIEDCDERGREIQAAMSNWELDRNGHETGKANSRPLPISKKPALMDSSVQLKSYQLLGLNWMNLIHRKGYSGILADDMGLGKTCQVISFIAHLVESGKSISNDRKPWPNLIVVPPSTYENWMNEFEKFAPGIKLYPYSGQARRDTDPDEVQDYHVVLTSYSQVDRKREDVEWLQGLDPYAAIFDEGHKLKNTSTFVYKQMSQVPSEWRLILSGTPVQNNLKELLSLLKFVEPSLFGKELVGHLDTIFQAKVANKDVENFALLAKERVGNARVMMAPFILQRRKGDVLDLPARKDTRIVVPLEPQQKEIYESIRDRYLNKDKTAKSKVSNPWMQLRKAALHPQLFRRHFTDGKVKKLVDILWKRCSEEELDVQSKEPRHKEQFQEFLMERSDFELHTWCKDFPKYIGHLDIPNRSWEQAPKVAKLLELIQGYIENGDRCLVFSRFEMVIDILRETFHATDIPYCELTGRASVQARFPEVERFTKDTTIPVFLLTTGAGGTGINLTAANKIVIFDQSDNPQDDVQASNRAHRIGQTREVEVITLITENTVEGLIYNSCVKKLMLAACVEGATVDDSESVEEQCRKLMLMDSNAEAHALEVMEEVVEEAGL